MMPIRFMIRISAILLSWRDEEAALQQIRRLQSWQAIPLSIVLVRNETTGEAFPVSGVQVINLSENLGYAGGVNAGLRALFTEYPAKQDLSRELCREPDQYSSRQSSRQSFRIADKCESRSQARPKTEPSELVLLLNNDAEVSEDTAQQLIRHLEANPDIGIIGPVLEENTSRSYGGRDPLKHINTRIAEKPSGTLANVDYVPGTALLFRAGLLKQIGFLNEGFFFSGEIADFCRRARESGKRCVVALDAVAQHAPADTEGLRATLYRYYTLRNRFLFAREQSSNAWPAWGLYWTLISALMWAKALFTNPAASRAVLWALSDGWQGRFGNRHDRFGL